MAAAAQGGQGEGGVAGRRGGDGHHRDPRVGQQALGVAGVQAVGGGQGVGPGPVAVGHGHRAQPRQLGGRLQDHGPEPPGPDQPEAEALGGPIRGPAGTGRPGRPGQLRGSAWRSFTGSSRPVGVT